MASSTHHHHHFPPPTGTTSAPPPTPSTTHPTTSSSDPSSDLLSRLLHRLPPSLSPTSTGTTPLLLRRRSSLSTTTTTPPIIPFTDLNSTLSTTLPTISKLGFFELTDHFIPSELAHAAESDSLSIFNLPTHQKHQHFPKNWPLGFDDDDEDENKNKDEDDQTGGGGGKGDSLFLDSGCSTESTELELSSLREFTREMEKIGLAVLEGLTLVMGLQNPVRDGPGSVSSLMWLFNGSGILADEMGGSGRFYPYVIGLHYQIRSRKCSLVTDTGLVSVLPKMDSILITLGDIAQVWSNGKLKKVRGKPILSIEEGDASTLSISLLVTLPLEGTVSPLLPRAEISGDIDDEGQDGHGESREELLFNSFSFEDYAWRVYHERVPLKDPLDRYRNKM